MRVASSSESMCGRIWAWVSPVHQRLFCLKISSYSSCSAAQWWWKEKSLDITSDHVKELFTTEEANLAGCSLPWDVPAPALSGSPVASRNVFFSWSISSSSLLVNTLFSFLQVVRELRQLIYVLVGCFRQLLPEAHFFLWELLQVSLLEQPGSWGALPPDWWAFSCSFFLQSDSAWSKWQCEL